MKTIKRILQKKITTKYTTPTTPNTPNTNQQIINILSTVKNYYAQQQNTIHVNAYERAIYQIKHWNKPITKGSELSHLIGIGKGMIEKIDIIIETGTLPIIKEKNLTVYNTNINTNTPLDIPLDTPLNTSSKKTKSNKINININLNILGFGKNKLKEIKKQYNARTINEIRNLVSSNKVKLTHMQEIGLKYYEDLNIPIPRKEIEAIGDQIKDIVEKHNNNLLSSFIAGSYPSGTKETSKDIDILIVVNDDITHNLGLYRNILKKLSNTLPLETLALGNEKFLGLIKSPISGKWRHLDIRITLIDNMPYAWLYYTGGKIFNKIIRERLKKKGYKLNEYGLYKVDGSSNRLNLDNGYLDKYGINENGVLKINKKQMLEYVEYVDRQIFEIADMEYKSVRDRY